MHEESELAAIGNTTAFPGHTLSPHTLKDLFDAQEECASDYVRRIERSCLPLGPQASSVYRTKAADNLRSGFKQGEYFFDSWALAKTTLPYLGWLLMRHTEKSLTPAQAADVIGNPNDEQILAIWEKWGYKTPKKDSAGKNESPPTGEESTKLS